MKVTNREEMIEFILLVIDKTHNEKDKKDLLDFSDEQIIEIYNELIDMNL